MKKNKKNIDVYLKPPSGAFFLAVFLKTVLFFFVEKCDEVEKWKAALSQEQNLKINLQEQLRSLEEKIQVLENEAEQLRLAKSAAENEAISRQEELSHAAAQLQKNLSNKVEETDMLKESFGSLLAEKEGKSSMSMF